MGGYTQIDLESYNFGYVDALTDAIESNERDDAMEGLSTTAGRAIALGAGAVAGGQVGLASIIYESLHQAAINKSTVASVSALTNLGIPEDKAKAQFNKTVKFFKAKHFLAKGFDQDTNVIMYSDLNTTGQHFMDGYYAKMDDVTEFSIEKAIKAKRINTGINSARIGYILNLISLLCSIVLIPVSFGLTIIGTIISAKMCTRYKNEIANIDRFDRTDINESDTKESNESVNIFSEDYFIV